MHKLENPERANLTLERSIKRLLAERGPDGIWEGRLSSSSLATAVASFALAVIDREQYRNLVRGGLDYIVSDQNDDGGWGDSPKSPSNITATLLCRAALNLTAKQRTAAIGAAEEYIRSYAGASDPASVKKAILARYGNDRTFAAPILTMCALSGILGPDKTAWKYVPQLPLELAALPNRLFKSLKLTVVSYALPALIAIGAVRHVKRPSANPAAAGLRRRLLPRLFKIARSMQPSNGGYEEASPITGFVGMSIAAAGHSEHELVQACAGFLAQSVRPDGSWPICTSLSTWLTLLAARALDEAPGKPRLSREDKAGIRERLLRYQHTEQHPLTFGAPGGWAWSERPGAMPDADDTSGVLAALRVLGPVDRPAISAADRGIEWLLNLLNSDGGMPTFSRGWGRLRFDRSCPDITAHAALAFHLWHDDMNSTTRKRIMSSMKRMSGYLAETQTRDGAWIPLWFGNQHNESQEGPVYGTAQVVHALNQIPSERFPNSRSLAAKGASWLVNARNHDGGWGGNESESSIEETALAVRALASFAPDVAAKGANRLVELTQEGTVFESAPIGLYFEKLWYSEKLYPLVFTVSALSNV